MNNGLDDMDTVIDRKEQFSCQNCFPIYGLEEENNKNTDQPVVDIPTSSRHVK